jgi:hypothetical protein
MYRLLVGKPEGRTPLGRPSCRWVDNIKMDVVEIEIGWCGVDWICVAWDRDKWRSEEWHLLGCYVVRLL